MPESLGVISELVELDLSGNRLKGEVPASLAQLSQLRALQLESNSLSSFPPPLCERLLDDSLAYDLADNTFGSSPDCASRLHLSPENLDSPFVYVLASVLVTCVLGVLGALLIAIIRRRQVRAAVRLEQQEFASTEHSRVGESRFSEGPLKAPWANSVMDTNTNSAMLSVTAALPAGGPIDKPPSPREEWFSKLFGFSEGSYAETKRWLRLSPGGPGEGNMLESVVNGARYRIGAFKTPALSELWEKGAMVRLDGELALTYKVGDFSAMHASPENKFATFQVESQFNCLEFGGPSMAPEDGVTGYMNERSQGCACSIACGPATVFRNYFAPVSGGFQGQTSWGLQGQTRDHMINNLSGVSEAIGNVPEGKLFHVQGGYVVASEGQLQALAEQLAELQGAGRADAVRAAVRVGVQEDVQVTATGWGSRPVGDPNQVVTQVFCGSAQRRGAGKCEAFTSLILEASYEAVLWAGLLSVERHRGEHGSRRVFLSTFSNTCGVSAVAAALERVCGRFRAYGLEVILVGSSREPLLEDLARRVP